jgi:hypothetical protein
MSKVNFKNLCIGCGRTVRDFASAALRTDIGKLLTRLIGISGNAGQCRAPAVNTDNIMRRLSNEFNLAAIDGLVDQTVASTMSESVPAALREEILVNYLGFSFWDVWTFSTSEWHQLEEHREIRVDRISPADTSFLKNKQIDTRLKGARLRHFAGFLRRSIRENDYLWGRLHGAERLIDIVCSAAAAENAVKGIDIKTIKHSAFRSILDTEDRCFVDKETLATVRRLIDSL